MARAIAAACALLWAGAALGASEVPGFPVRIEGAPSGPPIALAIPGGHAAICVVAGGKLWAFLADGSAARGFPVALPKGAVAVGGPAARAGVIAVALEEAGKGRVALFDLRGKPAGSFALPASPASGVSLADLGDGKPSALVCDKSGRLHALGPDGSERAGFPALLGEGDGCSSTPAAGQLGGALAIVAGTASGKLHALDGAGKALPGFPAQAQFAIGGWPALADLDGDGAAEVIFGSEDFHAYALRADGKPLAGFPAQAGYRVYGSVALADLQGEGRLSIAAAAGDGKVYAWDPAGVPVAGFPVAIGARVLGGVVAADVDRDGKDELVAVSLEGQLAVLRGDGAMQAGFPVALGAEASQPPLVLDLESDGPAVIAAATADGKLHVLRVTKSGSAQAPFTWPSAGRDASHAGGVESAVVLRKLAIEPASPRAADGLRARWEESAAGSAVRLRWLRDGQPVQELDGAREVPKGSLRRGQKWRFVAQGRGARPLESPEVVVANTPPTAPGLKLQPAAPRSDEILKLQIAQPATDADGDPVRYRVRWLRDGEEQPALGGKAELPPGLARKGELWTALVVAHDEADDGPEAQAQARIANAPPGPLQVALPESAGVLQELQVRVVQPAIDPDGDPLRLLARWTIDGKSAPVAAGVLSLPAGLAKKGQLVEVRVRASDGVLEGPEAQAQARIADTPPSQPAVRLEPPHPRRGDQLRHALVEPARDADEEAVTYRVGWTLNGALAEPPRELLKGQRWQVDVTPLAGGAEGPAARAEVLIEDTPPLPPRIALTPAAPRVTDPIEVQIAAPASDADGDPVTLEAVWTIDDRPVAQAGGALMLPAGAAKKHQRVRVAVTALAAGARSKPVEAEVVVQDSPPSAPRLALEPAAPAQGTGLAVRIVAPAQDADGDPVEYRVAWWRDGLFVPSATQLAVPAHELRHGQRWRAEVTPFDGEVTGELAALEVVIVNRPPGAPVVALTAAPTVVTGLRCEVKSPASDPDGDPVSLRFHWWRDGEAVPLPRDAFEVPRALLQKDQRWRVQVTPFDGELEGPAARVEATIGNAPPPGDFALAIEPAEPRSGSPLHCGLAGPLVDPDGDALSLEFRWTLDGKPQPPSADPQRIDGSRVRRGQRWKCQARASDGALSSAGREVEVRVRNSPPGRAQVQVEPRAPAAGQPLTCAVVAAAEDPDGDAVAYRVSWLRDDQPLLRDQPSPELPGRLVHAGSRYRCAAVPNDGETDGPSARSAEVRVGPAAAISR